jgi:predicted O-methyltransferase YrrM
MNDSYKKIALNSGASQDRFEHWQLLEILAQMQPARILEIGVHTGLNLKAFYDAFQGVALYGIEPEPEHLQFKNFNLIKGRSQDNDVIVEAARSAPYDFIFIDGDHTYEAVKRDFEIYEALVRQGGIIGFHDIMRPAGIAPGVEVRKFWDELRAAQPGDRYTMEIWGGSSRTDGPHISDAPGIGLLFK